MPRPRSRSDTAILQAARTVLVERVSRASIRAIAARAGLSPAAILARFGQRESLVRAALAPPAVAPALAPMLVEPDRARLGPQLQTILQALGSWHTQAAPLAQLAHALDPQRSPRGGAAEDEPRLHHALAIWLARAQALGGVAPGDSHAQAAVVLAALQGQAAARALGQPTTDPARLQAALLSLLLTPTAGAGLRDEIIRR